MHTVTKLETQHFALELCEDGRVLTYHPKYSCVKNQVPLLHDVSQIAVGTSHALALTKRNEVYSWGCNNAGQLALPLEVIQTTLPALVTLPSKRIHYVQCKNDSSIIVFEDGMRCAYGKL